MQDYDVSAKSYLAQNLNVIMSVWKMDQHEFAALIGLNYPTFNNYMNQKSFPRIPTLLVISDVTGIPMDIYLRRVVPLHLIPESPIKDPLLMVRESGIEYGVKSQMERRMDVIEEQIRQILDKISAV